VTAAADARASVEKLLVDMATETERRRDWWRPTVEGWRIGPKLFHYRNSFARRRSRRCDSASAESMAASIANDQC
jgi:hypothetical protein